MEKNCLPDVSWIHCFTDDFLELIPRNVKSVVDLGCGRGIVGALLKIYREPTRTVGVDLFDPYLDFCKRNGFYTEVVRHDLRITPLPFCENEFDLAVSLEVLEHLPMESGKKLLEELERISKRVILSTPQKFFPQPTYDGNVYQQHLSKWTFRDLMARGYNVMGAGNLMILGREIPHISHALCKTTTHFPRLSSYMLASYTKPSH